MWYKTDRIYYHYNSVADQGCLSRIRIFSIPDQKDSRSRIRIHITEFKYFFPKKFILNSRKYDLGCSSPIRIPDPDLDFLPIPDPGTRGQKGTGSRIRIRNTLLQFVDKRNYKICTVQVPLCRAVVFTQFNSLTEAKNLINCAAKAYFYCPTMN